MRAQALDGSATSVLDLARRLGFLQIDPISTVAPPQYLVPFSRLGPYDRAELDRLLWEEKRLFEWNAFIYPIEDLPLIRARMLRRRTGKYAHERRGSEFLKANARFRRYVLRELEREGPLLSRELADHSTPTWEPDSRWWGTRNVSVMLELLHSRGQVAVVGRRDGQRLWDLAERWYPETDRVPLRDAEQLLAEKRRRAEGVRLERGELRAHPDLADGPVPERVTVLSPFDRLVYDRERAEALWGFRYRLEMYVPKARREYGYYVLPVLHGEHVVGRVEPVVDRAGGELRVLGAWGDTSRLDEALDDLARWLGVVRRPERV
ncbi:MAG: YcaQ family DNA glycosylase [Thermoleophilia bacterium]|nr:YcaQ family DNA glycosylase [Thermoleophilia bacterium]